MIGRPPRSTRPDTILPYTTPCPARPPPAANGCSATEPPSVPKEAVPPRLMLVSPAFDRDAAAAQVEAALAVARDADIAALLLRGGSLDDAAFGRRLEIGRASCRERVCQYV